MSDLHRYRVLRQMDGDKQYSEGDERQMTEASAKHLVELGVLKKLGKAEGAPKNKAEEAPLNKADPLDHDRNGKKGGSLPKSERGTKA